MYPARMGGRVSPLRASNGRSQHGGPSTPALPANRGSQVSPRRGGKEQMQSEQSPNPHQPCSLT